MVNDDYEKRLAKDLYLIDQVRQGNMAAFDQIFTENFGTIKSFLTKRGCSVNDFKDIYQDSTLALYETIVSRESFVLHSTLKKYLSTICMNKWRKILKEQGGPGTELNIDDPLWAGFLSTEVDEIQVNVNLEKMERDEKIKAAIKQLGEPCRTILISHYYHNIPHEEIAEMTGLTAAENVGSKKYKCMLRLRKILAKILNRTSNE
ncbi:MAG TPA: sigma-70 family RNA polymerase sigma factor [Dyadobacter sp.]|nr:sigma-70 family RNA polymerase sigma factor [Dyadobacter sp.]